IGLPAYGPRGRMLRLGFREPARLQLGRRADALRHVALPLPLGDARHVLLGGFRGVAGLAKDAAIRERWFAAERVGNVVVVVPRTERQTRSAAFAAAVGTGRGIALHLL